MARLLSVAATVSLLCDSQEKVTPPYWARQAQKDGKSIDWSKKVTFVNIEKESLGKVKKVIVASRTFAENRDILVQTLLGIISIIGEFEDGKFMIPKETKFIPKENVEDASGQDDKVCIPSVLQSEAKTHPVSGLNAHSILEKINDATFLVEAPKDNVAKVVTVADNSILERVLEALSPQEKDNLVAKCEFSDMSIINAIRVAINEIRQATEDNTTDSVALEEEEDEDTTKATADSEPETINIGCAPKINISPGVPLSASNTDRLMILLRKMNSCLEYLISKGEGINTDFVQSVLDNAQSSLGQIIEPSLDKAADGSSEAEVLSIDQIINYCNYAATYLWALAKLILYCNIHMTTMDPVVLHTFQNEVMGNFPCSLGDSFFISEEQHLDNKRHLTLHTTKKVILFILQANKAPKFDIVATAFCHICEASKNIVTIIGYDTFLVKENINAAKNYLKWVLDKIPIPVQVI